MMRLTALLVLLAMPVPAQTLCERLDVLDGDALTLTQGDARCSVSLALGGGRNIHCALDFPYQSAEAADAFADLLAEVTQCAGFDATVEQDQSVNHPDAYTLRTITNGAHVYAVSIKDKGALQLTLVSVRVNRP